MKKRGSSTPIRAGGILRWSTLCLLAGGLASCEQYTVTKTDVEMSNLQKQIDTLDSEKAKLMSGEVANNFHIPRVGYYHADANNFFEHPYGFEKDGRWFVNGVWQDRPGVTYTIAPSRPSPEALKKVDDALAEEQKLAAKPSSGGGGFGMGNALMMYWLLSGSRGMFSPGAGFQQARRNEGNWQRDVENKRANVRSYASTNPGYASAVQKSQASGKPIAAGQSVRGGFGNSRSSGGSSYGG